MTTTPQRATPRRARIASPSSGDRFIPLRSRMDVQAANYLISNENAGKAQDDVDLLVTSSKEDYRATLRQSVLNSPVGDRTPLLNFSPSKTNRSRRLFADDLVQESMTPPGSGKRSKRSVRHISPTPERILDAPEILDDYYLNLLDWSSQDQLAVALAQSVYLWTPENTVELCRTSGHDNFVSSVAWMGDGTHIAIGTSDAVVQIWDVERQTRVRAMKGHMARVSSLSWNNHVLSSGSRDSMIFNHDVRVGRHLVGALQGHTQEVCGLKWSPDGTQLASGGNDNLLCVWDAGNTETPKDQLTEHTAAVKAIAWCPTQRNLMATGGGSADRCIRFWNTSSGNELGAIDTKSQVCSIMWAKDRKELVSSHGFSQNQLIVWKYPTMSKITELTGHTARVLHLAQSPDGGTIVSAAGDETLRFWNIFGNSESGNRANKRRSSVAGMPTGIGCGESPVGFARHAHIR